MSGRFLGIAATPCRFCGALVWNCNLGGRHCTREGVAAFRRVAHPPDPVHNGPFLEDREP